MWSTVLGSFAVAAPPPPVVIILFPLKLYAPKWPIVPAYFPLYFPVIYFVPNASVASSITLRLYFSAVSIMDSISAILPNT